MDRSPGQEGEEDMNQGFDENGCPLSEELATTTQTMEQRPEEQPLRTP